jgi:EmrB/QacA subfamily drug resistance transporter
MTTSRSRWLALAVLCAGMLMIVLDGSIVTVALPAIQHDLRFTPANLTWTLNGYLIAFGGVLLLAGRLGDLVGRRRVFVAGLTVFTLASVLCAASVDQWMLIAARFVQGLGGAAASAVSLGMIVTLFTEPRERGTAIGAVSFVGAAGASIGAVLGGLLTDTLGWHWIFLINVPVGAAAIALSFVVLAPDRGAARSAGTDVLGAVLVTAGLMLGVYTIVRTDRYGWLSVHTLGAGAAAAALLAGFVVRQATVREPLLPLRMFRSRTVSGANVIQLLLVAAGFGFQTVLALYLQDVAGYTAFGTGLAMLPAALTIAFVSLVLSARVSARLGGRTTLAAGLVLMMAGLGLLARLPVRPSYLTDLLPTMLLIGGFGFAVSAVTVFAMSGASERDAGVASGLFNTTQQVGGALGVAVLTTLAATRAGHLRATGMAGAAAMAGGYRLAFAIAAALEVAALVVTLVVLRERRVQPVVKGLVSESSA